MPSTAMRPYGNLASYRTYIRPHVHKAYGHESTDSKHRDNVHELLRLLFVNGSNTTWQLAKIKLKNKGTLQIRKQDKLFRRLLHGRSDRGKYTGGVISMGLVVREKNNPYFRYRLSYYGIFYCIDALNPTKLEYDQMATYYSYLLPRIFGDWNRTKTILREDAYNLRVLAQGIYMNNINFAKSDNPLYELVMYLHTKYSKNFESISDYDLSEQISYWFYTFLLYSSPHKLEKILASDADLYRWYMSFFKDAKKFYMQRLATIRNWSFT